MLSHEFEEKVLRQLDRIATALESVARVARIAEAEHLREARALEGLDQVAPKPDRAGGVAPAPAKPADPVTDSTA